jgi:hypothetical protein
VRTAASGLFTDVTFTGQRNDSCLELYAIEVVEDAPSSEGTSSWFIPG